MENILNIHLALINLIVISSICHKFLKTSLELYRWRYVWLPSVGEIKLIIIGMCDKLAIYPDAIV